MSEKTRNRGPAAKTALGLFGTLLFSPGTGRQLLLRLAFQQLSHEIHE
jgi:hypothetical protein